MYTVTADSVLIVSSNIENLLIINPVINLEINKAGTFTFTMPPGHPYYNSIEKRKTLIDVYRDGELLFEGVATESEVDFYKQKKFTCEGELTFLNDSVLRPAHRTSLTIRQLLEAYIAEHNSYVESFKRFTVGQVTVTTSDTLDCYADYESTLSEIKEDLVDTFGGYLRIRHENNTRYIDYLAASPRTNNQVIKLGDNLLDLTQSLDTEDIATAIIPLGATLDTQTIQGLDERLSIKTASADTYHPSGADYVKLSSAVSTYGWIEKVVTFDDITTVSDLLAKGEEYLLNTQFENLVITAKAIDLGLTSSALQKFKILDQIRVVSAPHGLDRYFTLSKMTINLNNPENDTVTLGIEETKSLSAKTSAINTDMTREIAEASLHLKSAIANATALITGAEGGYVVIETNNDGQPIELKIQDALINPTKIWRWNINGLGYSSDGGTTYGLAMTMNGAIVADYITAGTMVADRIKGGTLEVGGSSLAANGEILIKDSSDRTLISISKYGMTLYDENGVGKAYLDHTGLTISGGTINASNIVGTNITSSCIIDTPNFRVDSAGAIYNHSYIYAEGEVNGSRAVGRLGVVSYGDFYASGTKNRIVSTENYGYKTFNAYETVTPYFGDIGEGIISDEGECLINIDEIMKECVDTDCSYQVFLQNYGEGDVWIKERNENYFIVAGTPGIRFGWELKAIQKGYDGVRFNEIDDGIIEIMERSLENG